MGAETNILWTHSTFNPFWGCQKVDPACDNCYALDLDKRTGSNNWGKDATRRFFGDKHWNQPIKWNKIATSLNQRHRVFCASMADVFEDKQILDSQRERLWKLIKATQNLDWQLLTKRANLIERYLPSDWGNGYPNVWLGVTVGEPKGLWRVEKLTAIPAVVHFISYEPMLEVVDWSKHLNLGHGIQWLIAGQESGPNRRPLPVGAAELARDQCQEFGVKFFLKQFIEDNGKKVTLPIIDGKQWKEFPR